MKTWTFFVSLVIPRSQIVPKICLMSGWMTTTWLRYWTNSGEINLEKFLLVSELKGGIKVFMFDCNMYYSTWLNIEGAEADNVDNTSNIYES